MEFVITEDSDRIFRVEENNIKLKDILDFITVFQQDDYIDEISIEFVRKDTPTRLDTDKLVPHTPKGSEQPYWINPDMPRVTYCTDPTGTGNIQNNMNVTAKHTTKLRDDQIYNGTQVVTICYECLNGRDCKSSICKKYKK